MPSTAQQIDIFGLTKEEEAIRFIQEHEPAEGWFVGISGGKDSTVLYDLVKKSGCRAEYYYSATGIDPPEIVKHIKRHMPDVIFKRPAVSFYKMITIKGFPTKFNRWCCDKIKKDPTKDVALNNRLMGIRSEESSKRAGRPQIDRYEGGQVVYKPIFRWLEWEIWGHIERYDLPYCSLYDEGFSRIGCVVCPFLCYVPQRQLDKHRQRWPKIYAAFERSMRELYYHGHIGSIRKIHMNNLWRTSLGYMEPLTFDRFMENWYLGKGNFFVYEGKG